MSTTSTKGTSTPSQTANKQTKYGLPVQTLLLFFFLIDHTLFYFWCALRVTPPITPINLVRPSASQKVEATPDVQKVNHILEKMTQPITKFDPLPPPLPTPRLDDVKVFLFGHRTITVSMDLSKRGTFLESSDVTDQTKVACEGTKETVPEEVESV